MSDIFDWTGAPGARFDDPASWFDATLDAPADRAPGADDTAVFRPGDWSATGGGVVGTLLIGDGASVTLDGTGTEQYRATTLTEGSGSILLLQAARLSVGTTLTIGHDAVLDISAAAVDTALSGSPLGPFSVFAGTLSLLGPADGAGGGSVVLGANTIEVGLFHNGNSGIGNDFAPATIPTIPAGSAARTWQGSISAPCMSATRRCCTTASSTCRAMPAIPRKAPCRPW